MTSRCCRAFKVPEGMRRGRLLPRSSRARVSTSASRSSRASGKRVDRRRVPRAARDRARRHLRDEVPGLLPDRPGLHPLGEGAAASRSGPGRGSGAGSLVAYALRITDLDPIPYNLLFERFLNPERVSHAGLRRRLLHGPARRGDRLRAREVRRRAASGRSRRSTSSRARSVIKDVGARDGHAAARGAAASRASCPSRAGQDRARSPRRSSIEPQAQGARTTTTPQVARAARHGDEARGADAPRRHARRRRRDQRGAALGSRAVFCHERRAYRHPVRQGRRRAAGLVKFDFLGLKTLTVIDIAGAADQRAARPQGRRRFDHRAHPARRRGDLRAAAVGRDDGRVPARVERHAAALQAAQARLLRGHRRRRGALPPGPARHRHGRGLRRAASTAARSVAKLHPLRRRRPQADLRRHRLPGAGHADRAASWPATRSAAPTCCAARWARRRPRRWPSRRRTFVDGALKQRRHARRTPSAIFELIESSRATASTSATRPPTR